MSSRSPVLGNLLVLARGLRRLGFTIGPDQVADAAAALTRIDQWDRDTVQDILRTLWAASPDEWRIFRRAFLEWEMALRRNTVSPMAHETYLAQVAQKMARPSVLWQAPVPGPTSDIAQSMTVVGLASDQERLVDRPLEMLQAEEIRRLLTLSGFMRTHRMPSYRRYPAHHGREGDMTATIREGRVGTEFLRLKWRDRRRVLRPVVFLLDMSGSMAIYHQVLLQFVGSAARRQPVEVFSFSTRVTRLTAALRDRRLERGLAESQRLTPDRGGGTKLAEALDLLWRQFGSRVITSRSWLVLVSDGLDSGEPIHLEAAVTRLSRRIGRLIWWNPYAGSSTYYPAGSAALLARRTPPVAVATWAQLLAAWNSLDNVW